MSVMMFRLIGMSVQRCKSNKEGGFNWQLEFLAQGMRTCHTDDGYHSQLLRFPDIPNEKKRMKPWLRNATLENESIGQDRQPWNVLRLFVNVLQFRKVL